MESEEHELARRALAGVREIVSPEYAASQENRARFSAATQKPAGPLADCLFEDAQVVYDSNLGRKKSAVQRIEAEKSAGNQVRVVRASRSSGSTNRGRSYQVL